MSSATQAPQLTLCTRVKYVTWKLNGPTKELLVIIETFDSIAHALAWSHHFTLDLIARLNSGNATDVMLLAQIAHYIIPTT